MKILIGTTNPSKVKRFEDILEGYGFEFLTLKDLSITEEPEENGHNPEENAAIKAKFYGKYFDRVICNDSGLYLDKLPLEDKRQPGLHIRTPQGEYLDDEAAINYYAKLVASLGGRVSAYYKDGIAVYNCGKVETFMEDGDAFYLVSDVSPIRHPGWPLDSLSVRKNDGTRFTEQSDKRYTESDEKFRVNYRERLVSFLLTALK